MKFQSRPTQVDAHKVGTPEGRAALEKHKNAFESKNLWDCWEIRTPKDKIELLTKDDWFIIDDNDGIYPTTLQELLSKYFPNRPPTHCLKCGNPTGYDQPPSRSFGQENGLCPDCVNIIH